MLLSWQLLKSLMSATTSLKLPDALKATIAKGAAFEGKTAHTLMLDTLQASMADALMRQQFYGDGETSYSATMRTNAVFGGADVKAYVLARVAGGKPSRPQAQRLDAVKPTLAE